MWNGKRTKKKKMEEKRRKKMTKNLTFAEKKRGPMAAAAVLTVWPLSNYGFGQKPLESPARDRSEHARLERLRAR